MLWKSEDKLDVSRVAAASQKDPVLSGLWGLRAFRVLLWGFRFLELRV